MHKIIALGLCIFYGINADCQSPEGVAQLTGNNHKPLIVGHRGGFDTVLPENSISLFDYITQNTCYSPVAVEFDIRESASGSLYIMHDETLERTTNGEGKITGLQDSYIESLFLKDRNGVLTTEKIPLFSEILNHFQKINVILMLDVKGDIVPEVIKQVQLAGMESKCILLTFTRGNTLLAQQYTAGMLISVLVQNPKQWNSLLGLNIPMSRLIAYISKETPADLITAIEAKNVMLMTDMSESIRNNSKCFEPDYYKMINDKMKVEIIITDYPLYVNKLFCN
jgi:glycerophosphoryl diester phosphodiesterase